MTRLIASYNFGPSVGGSPTVIGMNVFDTQNPSNEGVVTSNVDFTEVFDNDAIKNILTRDILAFALANWSLTLGPNESILFWGF